MRKCSEFNSEPLSLYLDPKAAKATITRIGVGGVRHLQVKSLWLQSLAKAGRLCIHKVPGEEQNGAGLNMKVHPSSRFDEVFQLIGLRRWDISRLKAQEVKHVEHDPRF